jgi:lysozyme family protein
MDENFEKAIKFVLRWEGGLTEDKNDPGGLTKYGISQKSYPYLNIRELTLEKAKQIYYENYWKKADCDILDFPMNLICFDTAVNLGVSRAKNFNLVNEGWQDYLFLRLEYYTKLKNFKYYGKGWCNRIVDLYNLIRKEKKILK